MVESVIDLKLKLNIPDKDIGREIHAQERILSPEKMLKSFATMYGITMKERLRFTFSM